MPWMIVMILLTLLDTLSSEVACIRLADIYWNATNPIFRIDNTDHIIDVNKNNLPFEYDQVNIICPVYPHAGPGTMSGEDEEEEQYIIYNVSKDEYDSCRITNPNPRIIAVCDKPNQLMYFTITFRSFTPQPGGLEFLPGHDYYFVSTSSGSPEGLHQLVGGRCATHNMKVIFKVCCDPNKGTSIGSQTSSANASSAVSVAPVPRSTSTAQPPQLEQSRPASGGPMQGLRSTLAPRWPRPSPAAPNGPFGHLRPYEVPIEDEMDKTPMSSTKNKDMDDIEKIPKRERAKNEELINAAPPLNRWSSLLGAYICVVACLLHQLLIALLHR